MCTLQALNHSPACLAHVHAKRGAYVECHTHPPACRPAVTDCSSMSTQCLVPQLTSNSTFMPSPRTTTNMMAPLLGCKGMAPHEDMRHHMYS